MFNFLSENYQEKHEKQADTETLKEFKCIDNNCQFVKRKTKACPV